MEAIKARAAARKKMIRQIWAIMGVTAIGLLCAFILIGGVILIFK
jgi:CBS-domain-containing membrane protein